MAGKVKRDPNAPKRNLSAYLLYQNAMRDQFRALNPGMTFGQLAKYTSHMYRNLSPEEKQTWVVRAEQDKARYDAALAAYTPPPGHDARGNLIEQNRPKRRNKRTPKDPDAPKRASGAYVFFTNEMRPIVMLQFPGIKFVEMGRILGERWRALTPEEKVKFETMAADDKMRFQSEMQQYTASQAAQHQQQQALAQAQAQVAAANQQAAAAHAMAGTHQHVAAHGQQQQQMQQQYHGVQPPALSTNANVYMDPHQQYADYQHQYNLPNHHQYH
mmetsp:Transcript_8606/g.9465  ORF Transcript_8606/g.9465 Transcript_8606/m.9465 type:complete len:272 (+) Transcript_8606:175-990(+)